MKLVDLTGSRFGMLVVLRRAGTRGKQPVWACRCDCGNLSIVDGYSLRKGHTKSCGCLKQRKGSAAVQFKHGRSDTKLYRVWRSMLNRCENQNVKTFHLYGGRGICVCSEWHDFQTFLADIGEPPPGMTLERRDNDGNYEPANCEWVTQRAQCNNRRTTRRFEYRGELLTARELSDLSGIPYGKLMPRLRRGWSAERAISEPFHNNIFES